MASEREILLLGVLNQLDLSGKIDYKILARDIGAPTPGAAAVRWSRFRSKLRSSAATTSASPTKPIGVKKNSKSPSKAAKAAKSSAKKESSEEEGRGVDELDRSINLVVRRTPARKSRAVMFRNEPSKDQLNATEEKERCDEAFRMMDGVKEEHSSSPDQSNSSPN